VHAEGGGKKHDGTCIPLKKKGGKRNTGKREGAAQSPSNRKKKGTLLSSATKERIQWGKGGSFNFLPVSEKEGKEDGPGEKKEKKKEKIHCVGKEGRSIVHFCSTVSLEVDTTRTSRRSEKKRKVIPKKKEMG